MQRRVFMNVVEIIKQANAIAEEDIDTDKGIGFVNDAISRINVKCRANFPFIKSSDVGSEYVGFTETWQRALLVPFTVGRIKQADSSQFEYSDAYGEFTDNLIEFKSTYAIPSQYKDVSSQTSIAPNFDGNYFSWGGNGTTTTSTPDDAGDDVVDGGEW
jgi:hypothetical protein